MDRIAVGQRLRNLRGDRTLDEVAKALGVTSMAVSLCERGERILNDEIKIKTSAYYKTSVTEIFFAD